MDDGFPRLMALATTATMTGIDTEGRPLVFRASGVPEPALSLVAVTPDLVGRAAAVLFFDGGAVRLLLIGLLQPPAMVVETDGARRVISARETLTLRCGKASITLEADGRITLRGTDLLSRAEGTNRVQGASVQLN